VRRLPTNRPRSSAVTRFRGRSRTSSGFLSPSEKSGTWPSRTRSGFAGDCRGSIGSITTSIGRSPGDRCTPSARLAAAIDDVGLDYVVITSVDRDDLSDGGAEHFAECIQAIKDRNSDTKVEVLVPDFMGETEPLRTVVRAGPDVIGHNLETVRHLQGEYRDPRAGYYQSLSVLERVKKLDSDVFTKSSLMLGFGEDESEVHRAMDDLRGAAVDILTLGQYLRPSKDHPPVEEYVPPEQFEAYRETGESKGFLFVASGPTVRSSYRAGEFFVENAIEEGVEPDTLGA
jgi:lipoic acid synthetase